MSNFQKVCVFTAFLLISVDGAALIGLNYTGNGTENATDYVNQPACDKTPSQSACEMGSRMYRILSYDVDASEVLDECKAACNESYHTAYTDFTSCKVGCANQVSAVAATQNQLWDYESRSNSFINEIQMQQLMSHWMFEMIAGFDLFNDWYDDSAYSPRPDSGISTYVVVEQSNNQLRISSYRVREPTQQSTQRYGLSQKSLNPYADSDNDDFVPCFSMTSYSRLVLSFLLLISALFLVWLTCSTVSTSPKHRVKGGDKTEQEPVKEDEKLSLKMLMAYHPNGPVPVHSYRMDEDEKMLLA